MSDNEADCTHDPAMSEKAPSSMKSTVLRLFVLYIVTTFIGWLDYITGDELDLFILYFLPVAYAAWTLGSRAGILLSFTSAALWYLANVYFGHAYSNRVMGMIGGVVFLATFVGVSLATSRIRGLLDRQRVLNAELSDALAKVKKLSGRMPICMGCKSIRDSHGDWHPIEEYFTHQSEDDFVFQQTVCPHCRVTGPGAEPRELARGSGVGED
jgi:K+-sensing histidine kinase KdpD